MCVHVHVYVSKMIFSDIQGQVRRGDRYRRQVLYSIVPNGIKGFLKVGTYDGTAGQNLIHSVYVALNRCANHVIHTWLGKLLLQQLMCFDEHILAQRDLVTRENCSLLLRQKLPGQTSKQNKPSRVYVHLQTLQEAVKSWIFISPQTAKEHTHRVRATAIHERFKCARWYPRAHMHAACEAILRSPQDGLKHRALELVLCVSPARVVDATLHTRSSTVA